VITLSPQDPLPFETAGFVEAPGLCSDTRFEEQLMSVAQRRSHDIHISSCTVSMIHRVLRRLKGWDYDVYVRMANTTEGEFWLKRRPTFT